MSGARHGWGARGVAEVAVLGAIPAVEVRVAAPSRVPVELRKGRDEQRMRDLSAARRTGCRTSSSARAVADPWADLYAEALTATGRAAEADTFLQPHELHVVDGPPSAVARLARARGRVEAALDRPDAAEPAFRRGLAALDGVGMPFERGLLELAYGEVLTTLGRTDGARPLLDAAHARFAGRR